MVAAHPAAAGETLARALYERHGPALARWLRRRCGDPHLAEEVLHETVLHAWRHYDQFDPGRGSERAWMFGIARNAASSRDRTRRRHLRVLPDGGHGTGERAVDDVELARLVDRSLIVDALAALSADHRAVVVGAYFERRSTRELSERLGIAEGTVKSRLHHALRALRANLEERNVL